MAFLCLAAKNSLRGTDLLNRAIYKVSVTKESHVKMLIT